MKYMRFRWAVQAGTPLWNMYWFLAIIDRRLFSRAVSTLAKRGMTRVPNGGKTCRVPFIGSEHSTIDVTQILPKTRLNVTASGPQKRLETSYRIYWWCPLALLHANLNQNDISWFFDEFCCNTHVKICIMSSLCSFPYSCWQDCL